MADAVQAQPPMGCHTATDPVDAITGAGFDITAIRRLKVPDSRVTQPSCPHVLGTGFIPK